MASVPSSPPPVPLSTITDSVNTIPHSPKTEVENGAANNGVPHADDKIPDFNDGLDHLDSPQYIERFKKYEAEYSRRLLSKYFSGKTSKEENSFYEQHTTIDGQVIKASRLPCFYCYANPIVGVEEQCSNESSSPAETQASTPNEKHIVKKN
ncbi:uncharacterized protein [Cicer arietinum]|uniref:Uncharacterized protein LOC101508661 isoform X2 n=1 Tax=Cicer arietinum TaxID=3827 RepID=A0A1S2Z8B5_CICAR|nr:uncharacterized protein LOC101508661 isoform X2 [Cicer arietinum]